MNHVNKKRKTEFGAAPTDTDTFNKDDCKRKALDIAAKLAELSGLSDSYRAKHHLCERKVYPPTMTKHVNWVGMLMGPQGSTMKMLQSDTRCRFKFFGKGSNKNGPDEDPGSKLYVLVTADDPEDLNVGVTEIERIFNDDAYRNKLRESQGLKSLNAQVFQDGGRRSEMYYIPSNKVGLVIGKGGSMILKLQSLSGATLQVDRDPDPRDMHRRKLHLNGTDEQLKSVKTHIDDVVNGFRPESPGEITKKELVPQRMIGRVIGKGGETIRRLEQDHGCMVKVLEPYKGVGDLLEGDLIREVMLRGFPDNVQNVTYEVQQLTDFSGAHLTHQMAGRQRDAIKQGLPLDALPLPTNPAKKFYIRVRVPENLISRLLTNGGQSLVQIETENQVDITLVPVPDPCGLRDLTVGGPENAIKAAKLQLDGILDTTLPNDDIIEELTWKPTAEYAQYTEVYNNSLFYQQQQQQQQQQSSMNQQYPGYQQIVDANGQVQYIPNDQYYQYQSYYQQQDHSQYYQQQQQAGQQQSYGGQQQVVAGDQQGNPTNKTGTENSSAGQQPITDPSQQQTYQYPTQQTYQQQPYQQPYPQQQQAGANCNVAQPVNNMPVVKQEALSTTDTIVKTEGTDSVQVLSDDVGQGQILEHQMADGQVIHQLPNGQFLQLEAGQEFELIDGGELEMLNEEDIVAVLGTSEDIQ